MGFQFFHRYQILHHLGEGAKSHVLLVRDASDPKVLRAAKILKPRSFAKRAGAPLVREYQILETLRHENLLRVYDCRFLKKDRAPVLTTEFLEGSVDLEGYFYGKFVLTFEEKLQIAYQMLSAVSYLHQKKITHGDLKPANILLKKFPEADRKPPLVKIIDFDVSSASDEPGARGGTPYYMAPEAFRHAITRASDVYSLGVIFYRLFIHGDLPYQTFQAKEIFAAHMAQVPLFRPEHFDVELPRSLVELIRSFLQVYPKRRPAQLIRILQQLRLQFPQVLGGFRAALPDVEIREDRRFKAPLAEVTRMLEKGLPRSLFVVAPSGFGKTRFLRYVARQCQNRSLTSVFVRPRESQFWEDFVRSLLGEFANLRQTRKMRTRLLQALRAPDRNRWEQLIQAYLCGLSKELDGVVFLVDAIGPNMPLAFFETLRAVSRSLERRKAHCFFVFHVQPALSVDRKPPGNHSLSPWFRDLQRLVVGSRLRQKADRPRGVRQAFVPDEIQSLCTEGLGGCLTIPAWKTRDVKDYLEQIFIGRTFTDKGVRELTKLTRGNPGILQTVCAEMLTRIGTEPVKGGQSYLEKGLRLLVVGQDVRDLRVFRLKNFGYEAKCILACVVALEHLSRPHMEEIAKSLSIDLNRVGIQEILSRAGESGLVQRLDHVSGHYVVPSFNVRDHLRALAVDPENPLHALLRRLLPSAHLLTPYQRIHLCRFLDLKREAIASFLQLYEQLSNTSERLALAATHADLFSCADSTIDDPDLTWKLRVAHAETLALRHRFDEAEKVVHQALAYQRKPKALFILADLLRAKNRFQDAIECLCEAVQDGDISVSDRLYAVGQMSLCEIMMDVSERTGKESAWATFMEARKLIRQVDEVRYALLMQGVGKIYRHRKEYSKALTYYGIAAKLFARHGEKSRGILVERNRAQIWFSMGRYRQVIDATHELVRRAESVGLWQESLEILRLQISALYMMRQFRRIPGLCFHFLNICKSRGDDRALAKILEAVTFSYLELGQVHKAQALLGRFVTVFTDEGGPVERLQRGLLVDLLYMRIYLNQRDLARVKEVEVRIQLALTDLEDQGVDVRNFSQVYSLYEAERIFIARDAREALKFLEEKKAAGIFTGYMVEEAESKARLFVAAIAA